MLEALLPAVDWRHTQSQPDQLALGSPVPHELARRLAGHFAGQLPGTPLGGPRGLLAELYWTGRIHSALPRMLAVALEQSPGPELDSRGRRDSHAAGAELRALAAYVREQGPRGPVEPRVWWLVQGGPAIVPWGWRPAAP